jgi:hypothetical protein
VDPIFSDLNFRKFAKTFFSLQKNLKNAPNQIGTKNFPEQTCDRSFVGFAMKSFDKMTNI